MKTLQFLFLLCSSHLLWGQTYLAYAKQSVIMVDSNRARVRHIEKGDAFYLLSDKKYHGYFRVVQIKTHQEGFVSARKVIVEGEIPLTQVGTGNYTISEVQNPELVIRNGTHALMTVKIGEHEYDVPPHQTKAMHLSKGKYYYRVMVPEIDHYYGVEVLEEYKRYEWEFYLDEEKL